MFKHLLVSALFVMATSAHADLLLFGGKGHNVFLGCVDCSPYSSESICNEHGQYGSKYRNTIWNAYRDYGSKYRDTSPWNHFTTSKNVPVLVNKKGDFFGYFTINKNRNDAVSFSGSMKKIFKHANGDLSVVRDLLCDALH